MHFGDYNDERFRMQLRIGNFEWSLRSDRIMDTISEWLQQQLQQQNNQKNIFSLYSKNEFD